MISILLIIIYLSYISLGLPDALIGSTWPMIVKDFVIDISLMGPLSILMNVSTIFVSLTVDSLNRKFGSGKVVFFSILTTVVALVGFGFSNNYWVMLLFAIPYGLGAGGIDTTLNNYVALHYESSHMSWLHCMWGLGASVGPLIMSMFLSMKHTWRSGYLFIGAIQFVIALMVLANSKNFIREKRQNVEHVQREKLGFVAMLKLKHTIPYMLIFFVYCGLELTTGFWASSYFVYALKMDEKVAVSLASLFYVGITSGRFVNGFLTKTFSSKQLLFMGLSLVTVAILLIPFIPVVSLVLLGVGCAPLYPTFVHETPRLFGKQHSQKLMGYGIAAATAGLLVVPPLFGWLASRLGLNIFMPFLLILLVIIWGLQIQITKEWRF